MIIAGAELPGRGLADVRIAAGRVAEVGERLRPLRGELVLEAHGGALLPGLHDHHLHLMSLAAAAGSVCCGPPRVRDRVSFERALRSARQSLPGRAPAGSRAWIRGVSYDESVAGDIDRWALDRIVADVPLRIQHRSGQMWVLNSVATREIGLEGAVPGGVERDPCGLPTGRLFGLDDWLGRRLEELSRGGHGTLARGHGTLADDADELAGLGVRLARLGVTGVTDATVSNGERELCLFRSLVSEQRLPQRVVVMGNEVLAGDGMSADEVSRDDSSGDESSVERSRLRQRGADEARVGIGPLKIMLREPDLPALDELVGQVRRSHVRGRAVAVHCATLPELVLALGAYKAAGVVAGDRLEHAAVASPETLPLIAELGLTVVTQPNLVWERGDDYLSRVDSKDVDSLWRCGSLVARGIGVGGATDAPFGDPDPWAAMRAAVSRRTRGGNTLGAAERVSPERALEMFLTDPVDPGGVPRRLEAGSAADACLLALPWSSARRQLSSELVKATICAGELVYVAS